MVVVLLVPGLTGLRLALGDEVSVGAVTVTSAVLSTVVVAYLVALVRQLAHIEHRTQHDELDRSRQPVQFHERLSAAIVNGAESSTSVAVMFLDLDHFKVVNDSLGHAPANLLLQGVASRIALAAPSGSLVARLPGRRVRRVVPTWTSGGSDGRRRQHPPRRGRTVRAREPKGVPDGERRCRDVPADGGEPTRCFAGPTRRCTGRRRRAATPSASTRT